MEATKLAGDSTGRQCPSCQFEVKFMTEAFGCICCHCGTVVDEGQELVWQPSNLSSRGTAMATSVNTSRSYSGLDRERERQLASGRLAEWRLTRSIPSTNAIINGLLTRFDQPNLEQEVQILLNQVVMLADGLHKEYLDGMEQPRTVFASSSIQGREGRMGVDTNSSDRIVDDRVLWKEPKVSSGLSSDRMAVAATFSILKKHNGNVMLKDVSDAAAIDTLEHITDSLRYMEALLGQTELMHLSRDEPLSYLPSHIDFLHHQTTLKAKGTLARQRTLERERVERSADDEEEEESILEPEEHGFVKAAKIDSSDLSSLASNLAVLCSDNGLNNRSAKQNWRKDLEVCAWAILILAMEASSGRVCNEGRMARVLVWCYKTEGMDGEVNGRNEHRLNASTVENMVKKRYVEVSRMLTLYMERMPWMDEGEQGGRKKRPNRVKGGDRIVGVKEDISSIKPFPRAKVTRALADVVRLRSMLEEKMRVQGEDRWVSLQSAWSDFGSTEDLFHRIRASADGRRRSKEEEQERLIRNVRAAYAADQTGQSNLLSALFALLQDESREGEECSDLAASIGPQLLQLEALEGMSNTVVDSLLFREGEMQSYLRGQDEVRVVQALRLNTGEWDAVESSNQGGQKREYSEGQTDDVNVERRGPGFKRTKALSEAEERRLLSML